MKLPGSGGTVTFKYDPFGRRISKSSSAGTSIYAYDGDNLIEETNSSGGVVARYTQTLNIDEPVAQSRSGATSYYEADGLGSVTSLSNPAGALAQTYTFDSFGNLTASSGSVTSPFRYTGREFDAETGIYFYRARYYDPSTGRFLSEDPVKFDGGIDFYVYVSNNPLAFVDPTGTQLDSVTKWHLECLKLPTAKERCACHCVYAPDVSDCTESCMKCFSCKNPLKPHELCMCMCKEAKLPENIGKSCEFLCKGIK